MNKGIHLPIDSDAVVTQPPAKRPNKDPMPSHRPTPEQYAAMISAAAAAGQPLPRHHVRINKKIGIFPGNSIVNTLLYYR